MSHDWGRDPRPFSDVLVAWTKTHSLTREEAARQLGINRRTYDGWAYQNVNCRHERSMRLLMSLLDYIEEHSVGLIKKEEV